jgi:3-methyl-2-oxobutanoate hydroxymethyltransferase
MYTQLEQRGMEEPPVNVSTLTKMKIDGEPIACLTAYDASFALLVDRAGTDLILVGDSLGMVIQGHDTTVPVTVEDIIYHTRTVTRGLRRAFLVADMPFMSYSSKAQALDNAVRLMQEGGAMMVKLEGGAGQISIVEHLAHHDIPVCAHIGLRPQSVHKIGGFKVQGRGKAVQAAVHVPVIGIGAGPDVDGQILVLYDILGITHGRVPRFVENFMAEADSAADACLRYVKAVKERAYPAPQHCFS